MKLEKALARDKKKFKKKHGMTVSNRSIFVVTEVIEKKSQKAKKNRREKNED